MKPSTVSSILAVLALLCSACASAQADYPNKVVRMVVPWPPGGATDVIARHLAERLTSRLGQSFIIDNRPGATGQIGTKSVASAEPDGYTLVVMSTTVQSVGPHLSKTYPFDPIEDFTPVSQIVTFPYVLVVSATSPYNTLGEMIAAAKKAPGKLAYGSFGLGSAPYVITEVFAIATGTQLLHVPYKGGAPAVAGLLGDQINFFIDSLPSPLPQVRGGKLRALAVTTTARTPILPNVPTVADTIPGFEAIAWLGVSGPAKMPAGVAAKLNDAIRQATAEPEYGAKIRQLGADPVASPTPGDFRKLLVSQKQSWGEMIRSAKVPISD